MVRYEYQCYNKRVSQIGYAIGPPAQYRDNNTRKDIADARRYAMQLMETHGFQEVAICSRFYVLGWVWKKNGIYYYTNDGEKNIPLNPNGRGTKKYEVIWTL